MIKSLIRKMEGWVYSAECAIIRRSESKHEKLAKAKNPHSYCWIKFTHSQEWTILPTLAIGLVMTAIYVGSMLLTGWLFVVSGIATGDSAYLIAMLGWVFFTLIGVKFYSVYVDCRKEWERQNGS